MKLELSSNVTDKNLKIVLWGASGTRKTETGLRYFPDVVLVDCEGNSDHCTGMEEIPPFLRIKTKDVYDILDLFDEIEAGKVTFPDGRKPQTLIVDGATVLWSVRQEAGALNAENRARRKGYYSTPDSVTMTQLDWVKAKRPLKRFRARLNNLPNIKYVILTTREKDLYEEKAGELKKTGFTLDDMRGIDYEFNIAFRMLKTLPWSCEVTKVQGALGTMFPLGKVLTEFPYRELLAYATGTGDATEDELDVARRQTQREATRTQTNLLAHGKKRGLDGAGVAAALKAAGIEAFDPDRWDEMLAAVEAYTPKVPLAEAA